MQEEEEMIQGKDARIFGTRRKSDEREDTDVRWCSVMKQGRECKKRSTLRSEMASFFLRIDG